ncbi:MAG: M55 family metallopeptidase [Ktedonobacterales bacterium]|nr:M55 family metallopeptidase [Ktedonobacterales bacterium]
MNIYISIDAEGIAGISDWGQIRTTGDDFAVGRRLLLGELNAAIAGVLAVDPHAQILVNDAHGAMRNFAPDEIHGEAEYLSGMHKPLYMMEGLDATFDAILFIGYHGSVGAHPAILSHTYNPRAIWEVRMAGRAVGESALNGLVAAHYGVPIALVSGDDATAAEARALVPEVETVVVKTSHGRFAARSLHPQAAQRALQLGVQRALTELPHRALVPRYETPAQFSVTFLTADMAAACLALRHVEPAPNDARTVVCHSDNLLDLFRAFIGMILITRPLVD